MEEKKMFELDDRMKKLIALGAAVLVLILILLLLLHSCGGNGGEGNNDLGGGSSVPSTSESGTSTEGDGNEEIGYDEDLITTWYLEVNAMVLAEEGNGSFYYGDSDGGEFQWYTSGNRLTFVTAEKTYSVTYVIDGDNLTLTYDDGKVETWFR